jgi:hypothetical protein
MPTTTKKKKNKKKNNNNNNNNKLSKNNPEKTGSTPIFSLLLLPISYVYLAISSKLPACLLMTLRVTILFSYEYALSSC